MNKRKVYAAIGALAAAAMLGSSGCEQMVKSAVVEEYSGDSGSAGLTGSSQAEDTGEIIQKTVSQQVEAPEIYEATLTTELRSAGRKNKEEPMKFTLTARAPVEVPQTDAFLIKGVKRASGSIEAVEKMLHVIGEAQALDQQEAPISLDPDEESGEGTFAAADIPYRYAYDTGSGGQYFSCWFDASKMPETEQDAELWQSSLFEQAAAGDGRAERSQAEELVDKMGIQDFHVVSELHENMPRDGKNGPVARDVFYFERVTEGIPVNYVQERQLPVYEKAASFMDEEGTVTQAQEKAWMQESLSVEYAAGVLRGFQYSGSLEITDLSDEKQFLLPFAEIKDIFEKTIAVQMMSEENPFSLSSEDGGSYTRYPSPDADSVEMTITKVRLGYMRIREEGDSESGLLIPVWDFYGEWTAQISGEDGTAGTAALEEEYVPMLTIDARDGSVIQRKMGW